MLAYSTVDRPVAMPEGDHELTFLGVTFRGGFVIAEFLAADGRVFSWPKRVTERTYIAVAYLWRALGFPFREMRVAGIPPEEDWRARIGQRVRAWCVLKIGPSGKEYADVRWEARS
jgi:hypothetical protein